MFMYTRCAPPPLTRPNLPTPDLSSVPAPVKVTPPEEPKFCVVELIANSSVAPVATLNACAAVALANAVVSERTSLPLLTVVAPVYTMLAPLSVCVPALSLARFSAAAPSAMRPPYVSLPAMLIVRVGDPVALVIVLVPPEEFSRIPATVRL